MTVFSQYTYEENLMSCTGIGELHLWTYKSPEISQKVCKDYANALPRQELPSYCEKCKNEFVLPTYMLCLKCELNRLVL